MDRLPLLLGATLMMTALSGCAGDDSPPAALGCDPLTSFENALGDCEFHTEPSIQASVPDTIVQFTPTSFAWSLDNGTRGSDDAPVHSMDNRLVVITDGTIPTNMTDPRTEVPGVEFARQEHQNLPVNHTATLRWDVLEPLTVWGYMRIDGIHIWQNLGTVDVVAPVASGNTVTFTISAFASGGAPSLDDDDQTGALGDTITFVNNNELASYTVTFDCGNDALDPITASAGGSASTPPLVKEMQCSFVADNQASGTVSQLGQLTGQFRIRA